MTKTSLIKAILFHGGIVGSARALKDDRAVMPVLRYHSVSEGADYCPDSIAVTPRQFEWQIEYLASRYNIISLDQVNDCLRNRQPFPAKAVAITFDDGYLDNYETAFPVLKRYRAPATFFVVSDSITASRAFWVASLQQAIMRLPDPESLARHFEIGFRDRQDLIDRLSIEINRSELGARDERLHEIGAVIGTDLIAYDDAGFMMRKSHLVEMQEAGMQIGSHTVTHPILSSLTAEQATAEMSAAKASLESIAGGSIDHIAFPNGPGVRNYNGDTVRLALQCGYTATWTSDRGVISGEAASGVYPRQGINSKLDNSAFAFKLEEHNFRWLLRHQ